MLHDIAGNVAGKVSYADLGNIVLTEIGAEECWKAYDCVEPAMVGRMALIYGDINADGTLN